MSSVPPMHSGSPAPSRAPEILAMAGISKVFGSTRVLQDMQLAVRSHEIHALMGENGAGKSTLMKILAGIYQPDAGQILIDGQPVRFAGTAAARQAGINLIYQELSVAENMTVAQNIFMGNEPRGRFGLLDEAAMNHRADLILQRLGAFFQATTPAHRLSIAEQQQVEIARALLHEGRILIMDEPTAALSERETERLFQIVRQLREEGMAIIYISHRMAEVHALADRVTVLRDGSFVGELKRADAHPDTIVQMMVGRELKDFYQHHRQHAPGAVRLQVQDLHGGKVKPSSFAARSGEVLGLAGLVGAGRTELARLIFGADPKSGGQVLVDGVPARIRNPRDAMQLGIAYLPEDRKSQGLFMHMSVLVNTSLNVAGEHAPAGVIKQAELLRITQAAIQSLSVRCDGPQALVGGLSGGNQQKVLLARWLQIQPKVLILDEPTRGVDVGAKSEIYRVINELAEAGVAVICISSELPEIVGICDRVLVMAEGRITGELSGAAITQESVIALATTSQHKNARPGQTASPGRAAAVA